MIHIIPNWHPMFVHFPIAFATAALGFGVVGKLLRDKARAEAWSHMGYMMLWAAAISACIAAVFGWQAYSSVVHDDAGMQAMMTHRNLAIVAAAGLVVLTVWAARAFHSVEDTSYGFLFLLAAVWLLLAIASWHGGEMVYRHGMGVMALPDVGSEQNILPNDDGG